MASWSELHARGKRLQAELEGLMVEAGAPARKRKRRESAAAFDAGACARHFQHSSQLKQGGLRVTDDLHSAHWVRSSLEVCVQALNDLKLHRTLVTTADYIRFVDFGVMRRPTPTGGFTTRTSVRVHKRRPHTHPQEVSSVLVPADDDERTPLDQRLNLRRAFADMQSGAVSVVPLLLRMNVMWMHEWKSFGGGEAPDMELAPTTHPGLFAFLDGRGSMADAEFLPQGMHNWVRHGGEVKAPKMDNYMHAVCLFFQPDGVAVMVDTNDGRPEYVGRAVADFAAELGFELRIANLPEVNRADSKESSALLRRVGIQTPEDSKLGGYCAALSLAYMVDVFCTGRHDPRHFVRLIDDVVPRYAPEDAASACIALYARALASDLLQLCVDSMKARKLPLPSHWPPAILTTPLTTVRVRWSRGALRRVRTDDE